MFTKVYINIHTKFHLQSNTYVPTYVHIISTVKTYLRTNSSVRAACNDISWVAPVKWGLNQIPRNGQI